MLKVQCPYHYRISRAQDTLGEIKSIREIFTPNKFSSHRKSSDRERAGRSLLDLCNVTINDSEIDKVCSKYCDGGLGLLKIS